MPRRTDNLRTPNPVLQPPAARPAPRRDTPSFSASMDAPSVPASSPRGTGSAGQRALPEVASTIASALPGPAGSLVRLATGGGGNPQLDGMWEMQREQQAFNLEYLALQQSIQSENRQFSTMTNLLKAQHDTAKAAVSNIRV